MMDRYISSKEEFDEDEFREMLRGIVECRAAPLRPAFDNEISRIMREDVGPRLKALLESTSGKLGATVDVHNQAEYVVAAWIRKIASRAAYVKYEQLMAEQGYNPLQEEHFDPHNCGSDTPFVRLHELCRRGISIGSRWRDPNGRNFIAKAITPAVFVSFSEEGSEKVVSYSPLSDAVKSLRRS